MNEINALIIKEAQDKYCVFTYKWNLKNKTSEQIEQNRNRLKNTENKLVVTRGERRLGEGQNR